MRPEQGELLKVDLNMEIFFVFGTNWRKLGKQAEDFYFRWDIVKYVKS